MVKANHALSNSALVNTSYDMNNNWQGDPILMVLHQHCFRPVGEYPLLHSRGLLGRGRQ